MVSLPESSWDVHVHVFDPAKHPYIPNTRYTPPARSTTDLVTSVPTKNFVIVMSGPEGTNTDLTLESIDQLRAMGRDARGVVVMDVEQMGAEELRRLDAAGVRSVRFNTRRDGTSLNQLFEKTAEHLHKAGVKWSIEAAIFDIPTWHSLVATLRSLNELYGTIFVADHVFAAQLHDLGDDQFRDLLNLVDEEIVVVKISGLSRYGRDPVVMAPVIKAVLERNEGKGGVFGSDWPHVNSSPGSTELLHVDLREHLRVLRMVCDELGEGRWEKLMRDNARKLYR